VHGESTITLPMEVVGTARGLKKKGGGGKFN
jgi:hypothetical protein